MSLPLLTAVTPAYEAALTTKLGDSRAVHVVRRCADLAELLGAVAAGIGRVAVVSAELRGLDGAVIRDLLADGLLVLGVHRPQDEAGERTLRRWGVAVVLPADADREALAKGLEELLATSESEGEPGASAGEGASGKSVKAAGAQSGDARGGDARGGDARGGDADGGGNDSGAAGGAGRDDEASSSTKRGGEGETTKHGGAKHGGADHKGRKRNDRKGNDRKDNDRKDNVKLRDRGDSSSDGIEEAAQAVGVDEIVEDAPSLPGRIVAVWGPVGAPGRTTVAVNVAAELADVATPVILADLDTYGASVAQVLSVLDEAPGVAAAARAADQGTLDRATLLRFAPEVTPGLRILTGMPRPDRWPELREHAVRDVLAQCADLVPLTLVDLAFCLEADEELSFDTAAPRRNGAALTVLDLADEVIAVGAADPVSLQRLVRGLDQLGEVTSAPVTVAVNRVRTGAIGRDPGTRIREALHRFAGVEDVILIADDAPGIDAALLAGRTLREARASSPARTGLRELAARVAGRPVASPGGRGRRRILHRV